MFSQAAICAHFMVSHNIVLSITMVLHRYVQFIYSVGTLLCLPIGFHNEIKKAVASGLFAGELSLMVA